MADFSQQITERAIQSPFAEFQINGVGGTDGLALTNITKSFYNAKDDDKIKGVFLDLSGFGGGRASLEVVKRSLEDFKTSGKKVYAYADYYTEATYYLALATGIGFT